MNGQSAGSPDGLRNIRLQETMHRLAPKAIDALAPDMGQLSQVTIRDLKA